MLNHSYTSLDFGQYYSNKKEYNKLLAKTITEYIISTLPKELGGRMKKNFITKIIKAINIAGLKLIYGTKIKDFYIIENYGVLEKNEVEIKNYSDMKRTVKK